jgi:hypothetical protein
VRHRANYGTVGYTQPEAESPPAARAFQNLAPSGDAMKAVQTGRP